MRPIRLFVVALAILIAAPSAFAFGPTHDAGLVMRAGDTRVVETPAWSTPVRAQVAFDRLVAATGAWRGAWDADTDVPVRLWGAGIAAPGAQRDPVRAEAAARRLIEAHLDLLAPGSTPDDLELIGNAEIDGLRTVTFAQTWHGMRVAGATVVAMFKRDRLIVLGSTALPDVDAIEPWPAAAPAPTAEATAWLATDTGKAMTVTRSDALIVFPEVLPRAARATPAIRYTVARPVVVDATDGDGTWTVWIDAATGAPLARASHRVYDTGTLTYTTPERSPTGPRVAEPAAFAAVTVDGAAATTAHDGSLTWSTGAAASVVTGLTGPYINVFDSGGNPMATATLLLQPGGSATFDVGTDAFADAQVTTFTHGNLVKQFIRHQMNPRLPWVDGQMAISANEQQYCNAYADLDPDQVHFFVAGVIDFGGGMVWNCDNTGRIPDVIYHETGHNFHFRSLVDTGAIPLDINAFFGGDIPSLSEGLADTMSTAITHDAQLGPGFFVGDPNGLRNLDPDGIEKIYPQDLQFEPHADGEIIGEAVWDLRKALVLSLGEGPGQRAANRMFEGIVSHSTVFTSTYADALAADDDDGNLANGTPHQCELSRAFGLHGLAPAGLAGGVAIGTPSVEAGAFVVPIATPAADCPGLGVTAVNVTWRSRADTTQTGTVPLAANGATWTGALPVVPDGTVVQYQVAITFSDSSTATRPLNLADPYYEAYVGAVTTIRCDDFETDPGWTHAATTGTDEWQRAAGGTAPAAGDPDAAASATTILGTDVTDNGLYAASSDTYAETPAVDTTGYATIRLQYKRWLDVDDGFYDRATISAGGTAVWTNPAGTDAATATSVFRDGEWRFQDVDLTAAAATGSVQVRYGLTTDAAGSYGGWNLDDVCVVGIGAVCGDTLMRGSEQCDDGNLDDGDGCSATCTVEPPDMGGGCCQTGTDPRGTLLITAFAVLGLVIVLRKRRR